MNSYSAGLSTLIAMTLLFAPAIASAGTPAPRALTDEVAGIKAPAVATKSAIVKAKTVDQAAQAVFGVGGRIVHRLSIINAVSADLSEVQINKLRQDDRVLQVTIDRTLGIAGVSSGTHYRAPIDVEQILEAGSDGMGITVAVVTTP